MVDQRFSVSIHIMTVLAYHHDELLTSEQLATSIRTNAVVVRRLIAKLVEAGLVKSFKGKSGGVSLAKPAQQITLEDIYAAVFSDKALIANPPREPHKACAVSCSMGKVLEGVIDGLQAQTVKYMSGIKLSDLTSQITK